MFSMYIVYIFKIISQDVLDKLDIKIHVIFNMLVLQVNTEFLEKRVVLLFGQDI